MKKLIQRLLDEKTHKISGGIYDITQINMSYHSNRTEGSTTTEKQVTSLYMTGSIDLFYEDNIVKLDDLIENENHFRAFDYILDNYKKDIDLDFIKMIHKILLSRTSKERLEWFNIGEFKKEQNVIGTYVEVSSPENVEKDLKKLLKKYNKKEKIELEDIADFHYYFEKIHPFQDGNGRVGRLLMFKEYIKNNVMPFIVLETHKNFYLRGLQEYENEKGYLLETFRFFQDEYENIMNKKK